MAEIIFSRIFIYFDFVNSTTNSHGDSRYHELKKFLVAQSRGPEVLPKYSNLQMTSQASNDSFKKPNILFALELSSRGGNRGHNIWHELKIFLEKNK